MIKRALLNRCPQECLKSIRHTVKLVVYSYQIDSANEPPIQYLHFVCLNTELSGIDGYKGKKMGGMERGFPHLGQQGHGFYTLCRAISGKKCCVGLSTTCWLIAGGKPETVLTIEMRGPIGSSSLPTLGVSWKRLDF